MAKKEERFVRVYSENLGCEQILVDRLTGVNYLFVQSGYAGGLTVLVDANGKPIRVTAEQILSGIDASLVEKAKAGTLTDTEAKTFAKSLRKALSENSTLATLAVAEATGGIIMDTRRMAEAMLNGENLANTADLNRLIEKGKPEEMQALGQALGIEDWSKVTIDELRTRVAEFNANGGISEFAEQSKRMRRALEQGAESAKPLPHLLRKNMQDGVLHVPKEYGMFIAGK